MEYHYSSSYSKAVDFLSSWHTRKHAYSRIFSSFYPISYQKMTPKEIHVKVGKGLFAKIYKMQLHVDDQGLILKMLDGPFRSFSYNLKVQKTKTALNIQETYCFELRCCWFFGTLRTQKIRELIEKFYRSKQKQMQRDIFDEKQNHTLEGKKYALTGSHGLIGGGLQQFLEFWGAKVHPLVRVVSGDPLSILWDPYHKRVEAHKLENLHGVIHLAGENIASGLWTKRKKRAIFASRVDTTAFLTAVLLKLQKPPEAFLVASAIGIYSKGVFLPQLCLKWEEASLDFAIKGGRRVITRFGVVITPKGGMLQKIRSFAPLKMHIRLGDGREKMSWIALEDLLRSLGFCLSTSMEGPCNITSPFPVSYAQFYTAIAKSWPSPFNIRIPKAFLLLFSKEFVTELLLADIEAYPKELLEKNFHFFSPTIEETLRAILD